MQVAGVRIEPGQLLARQPHHGRMTVSDVGDIVDAIEITTAGSGEKELP